MFINARPYVRWWWFSGPLSEQAIVKQLEWIADMGFGGVEIAWVYPLQDTGSAEGPRFLDEEFTSYVMFAVQTCRDLHIGCDLTFGTLWPFGGSFIPHTYASKVFSGSSQQRLRKSWESRYLSKPGLILDHLNAEALTYYADHLLSYGFSDFAEEYPGMSFFCDSWEIDPEGLSYDGLFTDFSSSYGYDLAAFSTDLDRFPEVRYDYRKLLAQRTIEEFYRPFGAISHAAGAYARVQCHGAPTDILQAYGCSDIPETETMLFDPDFALFAASSAALYGKPVVSSESFTCIYGWVPSPEEAPGLGEEDVYDLRCVADAQFACGVNQVVWHGMPYEQVPHDTRFYATVHVGRDGTLNQELRWFNDYLTSMSEQLRFGNVYAPSLIYLPLEDQWMADRLPQELTKPSSHYFWELQETKIPDDLLAYRPLWISGALLKQLAYDQQTHQLVYGDLQFSFLYVDAHYIDFEYLLEIDRLVREGAPIVLRQSPNEPGRQQHESYRELAEQTMARALGDLPTVNPVLQTETPVDFWVRNDRDIYRLFVLHPDLRNLHYPLVQGFSHQIQDRQLSACFSTPEHSYHLDLHFTGSQSLLYEIDDRNQSITRIDLDTDEMHHANEALQ